eukprot:59470-Amphidinium_carterae.1
MRKQYKLNPRSGELIGYEFALPLPTISHDLGNSVRDAFFSPGPNKHVPKHNKTRTLDSLKCLGCPF